MRGCSALGRRPGAVPRLPCPSQPRARRRWQGRQRPLAAAAPSVPVRGSSGSLRERAALGRVRASVVLSFVILQGVFSYNEIIHVDTPGKVGWSAARVKAQERGEGEIIQ